MKAAMMSFQYLVAQVPELERLRVDALQALEDDRWVESLRIMIVIGNQILGLENVPLWFDYRWEDWRLETAEYLDSDESDDSAERPIRPGRQVGDDRGR